MARFLFVICIALAAVFHINATTASVDSIANVTVYTTQVVLETLKTVITQAQTEITPIVQDLLENNGITQITTLITGLVNSAPTLVKDVTGLTVDQLTTSLKSLLGAVQSIVSNIGSALEPVLKSVGAALSSILAEVGALLKSVLALVNQLLSGILTGLSNLPDLVTNLQTLLNDVLSQAQTLENGLVKTLTGVIDPELTTIAASSKNLVHLVFNDVLPNLSKATTAELQFIVNYLASLLKVDSLISGLLDGILSPIFQLVSELVNVVEKLLSSLVPALVGVLNLTGSGSCTCSSTVLPGVPVLGRRRRALQ